LQRELGSTAGIITALAHLALLAHAQGAHPRAGQLYAEALAPLGTISAPAQAPVCLEGVAALVAAAGAMEPAARLLGAAAAARAAISAPVAPPDRARHDDVVARVEEALTAQAYTALWREGEALSPEQAVAHAADMLTHHVLDDE
jgi:hypothetical protein